MAEPAEARESELQEEELPRSVAPLAALQQHRDFRLYWFGAIVSRTGTNMQYAAVAWQIYLLSHSAIALGLIGLFRVLPIFVFSLWGGVVADVWNRKRLLFVTQALLLSVSVVFTITTASSVITVWLAYLLTASAATAYSFDNPARQALIPSLVSRRNLPNALSLSSTTFQLSAVVGPSLAGIMIGAWGLVPVYAADVVSYFAVIIALILIHPPPIRGGISTVSLRAAIEGLSFVRQTPIILSTMTLDFIATFFGSAMALLPIFAKDILHVGSQGYGLLYASPAIGAVIAGIYMSFYSSLIRKQGLTILVSVVIYALCTILFGFSRAFVLSLIFLAGSGAADTVSMILRQTVRQTVTPDALRGRMTSVNMVFFMGGPQLGELEAGIVARALGAPFSVISGGIAALLATGLIAYLSRSLVRYTD